MSCIYPKLDWQDILPLGKYRGHMVGDIFDEDPGYLFWMINNTTVRFKEHVVNAVDEECGERKEPQ